MVDFDFLSKVSHATSMLKVLEYYGISYHHSANERYKALCPFHNDHTPSLMIYTHDNHDNESFCCFVDGSAGDPFRFLQLMEGEFRKAWSVLCHINGIDDEDAVEIDELEFASKQLQEVTKVEQVSVDAYNLQLSVAYRDLLVRSKQKPIYAVLAQDVDRKLKQLDTYLNTKPSPAALRQYYMSELQYIKYLQSTNT